MPYLVAAWRNDHPGQEIPDGQVFTQPWAGLSGPRRDQVIYYQYRADRARRSLRKLPGYPTPHRPRRTLGDGHPRRARTSRYTMPVALPAGRRDASTTANALIGSVTEMPAQLVKTLTWDQGSEMAARTAITLATTVDTSPTPTRPGNAAPTRTPTGCYARAGWRSSGVAGRRRWPV